VPWCMQLSLTHKVAEDQLLCIDALRQAKELRSKRISALMDQKDAEKRTPTPPGDQADDVPKDKLDVESFEESGMTPAPAPPRPAPPRPAPPQTAWRRSWFCCWEECETSQALFSCMCRARGSACELEFDIQAASAIRHRDGLRAAR
jgi:hypothetical protein